AVWVRAPSMMKAYMRGVLTHSLTDKHAVTDGHGQAHAFVVGIADPDGEWAAVHAGVKIEDLEQFHAILGYSVFIFNHADMPKTQSLGLPALIFVGRRVEAT
ncbi:MAG: hypothetical protein JWO48_2732, partial [Bryobacterales bacterium]|nr:hypothetical protein [Bryobacterales bacterium]